MYRVKGILIVLSTVISAALFHSCKKDYNPVPDYLDEIYPIEDGKMRVYSAFDTLYGSQYGVGRTFKKKEVTNGTETDIDGRLVSLLWIYEAEDSTDSLGNEINNWQFKRLWSQYKDDEYADRTEGTNRILVLRIPPMKGFTWNGNLYNALGDKRFEVKNMDTTVTLFGQSYEHCVYVLQRPFREYSNPEFYLREHAYEIYAPGIGKIVRHDEYVEIQNPGFNPQIDTEKSHFLHEELLSHTY